MFVKRIHLMMLTGALVPAISQAQNPGQSGCREVPREDALPFLCAPPTSEMIEQERPAALILLTTPTGTNLRVVIDRKVRIANPGEPVSGKLAEAIYVFDQVVIPAGSVVTGRVAKIEPIETKRKILSYVNGNFSPFHGYELDFDTVILPSGEQRKISTAVSPGISRVVHLVAGGSKEKQKSVAGRAVEEAKREASSRVHDAVDEMKAPGLMERLKEMLLAQSPYRRQYVQPGSRFYASLTEVLDFGTTTRTAQQLARLGMEPEPDSVLHARFEEEVSSATAQRGTQIAAVLTEPLFSQDHHLLLPANSRLDGEVLQAKPARKLHHNGDLRVIFNRLETPEGHIQPMQGSVEGIEADRRAGLKLDEEGGARATDPKSRYLSTGVALLLAAATTRPDVEHGTTDAAGDPGLRAGAGVSGSGITGSLISLAARSQPVSAAFAVYGAGTSVYVNFLSRGKDVIFAKNTPLEIGFGAAHPNATKKN